MPRAVFLVFLVLVQIAYIVVLRVTPIVLIFRRRLGLVVRGALALVLGPLLFHLLELIPGVQSTGDRLAQLARACPTTSPSSGRRPARWRAAPRSPQRPRHSLSRPWRRAVWSFLGVLAVLRVVTATSAPLDVVLAVGAGGLVGSAMVMALGRTLRR